MEQNGTKRFWDPISRNEISLCMHMSVSDACAYIIMCIILESNAEDFEILSIYDYKELTICTWDYYLPMLSFHMWNKGLVMLQGPLPPNL